MEYYSAIKMNEFESVVVRWVNLEEEPGRLQSMGLLRVGHD